MQGPRIFNQGLVIEYCLSMGNEVAPVLGGFQEIWGFFFVGRLAVKICIIMRLWIDICDISDMFYIFGISYLNTAVNVALKL